MDDLKEQFKEQLTLFLPAFAPIGVPVVTELRVLGIPGWKPGIKDTKDCGFFNLSIAEGRNALFNTICRYVSRAEDQQPEGIYLTMNPVDPDFLSRANNCMGKPGKSISVDNEHITRRRWFVVDADPTRRISDVSATDDEKKSARLLIDGVRDDLRRCNFAEPMFCDSGNGFHLWYRIDLPADDGGFVEHTLKRLAKRHNTAGATVDAKVFDAARIMKIPGTWARKGSSTATRPHRMARVLEVPRNIEASNV